MRLNKVERKYIQEQQPIITKIWVIVDRMDQNFANYRLGLQFILQPCRNSKCPKHYITQNITENITQDITRGHMNNKAGVRCSKRTNSKVKYKVNLHDICFEIFH